MPREMNIDGTPVGEKTDCYVIAEVGHNHQGSVEQAKEFFLAAKKCGASAVKLQKRDNHALFTEELFNKPYENENSYGATYGEHREALEFGKDEYVELQKYCKEIGITFFATAFDIPSVDFLEDLNMPVYKVASGDIRNTPLIEYIAKTGKPMIISTGASVMEDAERAFATASKYNDQVAILQCTSGYPAKFEDMDLRVITTYCEKFPDAVIGLSGHDNGIVMAVASYVLGARIVEKHFTLDRAMKGTDHAFSLEPQGMGKMVRDLHNTRLGLGISEKRIHECEEPAINKMGKQLVAVAELPSGHVIRQEDIAIKSPGGGIQPYEFDTIVGQTLTQSLKKDEPFAVNNLK